MVRKEPGLFDYITDLSSNKEYLFEEGDCKNYAPFMVNRGFGQHLDTILLANELNKRSGMSKLMHHDFLFYAVDRKKRYGKWAKAEVMDESIIKYMQETYNVCYNTAVEYIKMYDLQELKKLIKKATEKGGKQ